MTYELYDKDKHTLEVGTKIRLAGREGFIVKLDAWGKTHSVQWPMPDTGSVQELYLVMFPELQIAVSPLTIDKRVKKEIINCMDDNHPLKAIEDYLNSLEEV